MDRAGHWQGGAAKLRGKQAHPRNSAEYEIGHSHPRTHFHSLKRTFQAPESQKLPLLVGWMETLSDFVESRLMGCCGFGQVNRLEYVKFRKLSEFQASKICSDLSCIERGWWFAKADVSCFVVCQRLCFITSNLGEPSELLIYRYSNITVDQDLILSFHAIVI
jgi:hypothetical protein